MFKKGQSGNPLGRSAPNDKPLTDALRRKLFADERKRLDELVTVTLSRAMSGDSQAIRDIWDRIEGKPVQQIDSHNINENHYVRAPEKATKDDWEQYLKHKTKPAAAADRRNGNSNGSGSGKAH